MHAPIPRSSTIRDDIAVEHVLFRDIETRSTANLKKIGAYKYATDEMTAPLCMAYAVDDGPVQVWLPSDPPPPEFFEAAANLSWRVCAHNNSFESFVEQYILAPRYGFPLVPLERHYCTMATCLSLGLPAKLHSAADVLELENRKDAGGERLMRQMSRPRKAHKDEDPAAIYWFDDEDRLQRLFAYCKQDVRVARDLYCRLPPLSAAEQSIWVLSTKINERGFHVDRKFAEAARQIALHAAPEIDAEISEITGGAVTSINQVAKLLAWVQERGCAAQKLDRKAVERQLEKEDLPAPVRRGLELRLGGAQAATKKINSLLARAGDDDRVRGAFRYHGAGTGRWAGEGFQPQNLKRATVEDLDAAIAAVATGDYAHMKTLYPRPLSVVGDCSRSMITAAPGNVLIGADFSAIESRALSWISNEGWKLDAFRRYDATHDAIDEPYCTTACRIFGKPAGTYTKDSPERGVGKTCDLAFGYQGGLAAWRNFQPDKFSDQEVEIFKNEWRAAHPATVNFWYSLDRSAVLAVQQRNQVVRCGRIDLRYSGAFLQMRLPSGRKISYPQPRIITDTYGKPRVVFSDNAGGQFKDCRFGLGAYGGLWTENAVSGVARDLLTAAMRRVEIANYATVMHVHDEIICEVPIGFGSTEEFARLMTRKPSWALELPIAANVWTGPRYCK